jgi:hypothetical protein
MRKEKENLDLECKLTDVEILAYSREMAEQFSRQGNAEYRKSVFNKQIASELEEINATISGLSQKVKSGSEYRQVECEIVYDFTTGKRHWYRKDTGEEVKEAKISEEDLQEHLALEEKQEAEAEAQAAAEPEVGEPGPQAQ